MNQVTKVNHAHITNMRSNFHQNLVGSILTSAGEIPSNADKSNKASVAISQGIFNRINGNVQAKKLAGQTAGNKFEEICEDYLKKTFLRFPHLRPGAWFIKKLNAQDTKTMPTF